MMPYVDVDFVLFNVKVEGRLYQSTEGVGLGLRSAGRISYSLAGPLHWKTSAVSIAANKNEHILVTPLCCPL